MQCILTRADFDVFFSGEGVSLDQPQAFTCPICGDLGFTETTLQEHVTSEHTDPSVEVVCPICASLPGGDPNHVTDDIGGHLSVEHRSGTSRTAANTSAGSSSHPVAADPGGVAGEESSAGGIRHVRRIPHPGRGVSGARARRTNMHFSPAAAAAAGSSALASLSPGNASRDAMDPIAELLQQLSGVRRSAAAAQSTSSQLQQLQMQLQLERQQVQVARQQQLTERGTNSNRRSAPSSTSGLSNVISSGGAITIISGGPNNNPNPAMTQGGSAGPSGFVASGRSGNSQFLLSRIGAEGNLDEDQIISQEADRAERGQFVQQLLISTLLLEKVDLDEDFMRTLEDDSFVYKDGATGIESESRIWPYSEPITNSEVEPLERPLRFTGPSSRLLPLTPTDANQTDIAEDSSTSFSSSATNQDGAPKIGLSIGPAETNSQNDRNRDGHANGALDSLPTVINGAAMSLHTNGSFPVNGTSSTSPLSEGPLTNLNGQIIPPLSPSLPATSSPEARSPLASSLPPSPSAVRVVTSAANTNNNSRGANRGHGHAHRGGTGAPQGGIGQDGAHHSPHAGNGRGRRRVSKDGFDGQNRRPKEREPPPH